MQPQMPLLAELCLADNSLSPFAFTCLTEFTYPTNNLFLVRNSSFPCRQDYVFQGEDFAGMQYKTTRCTYNPLTRTWYVGAVANAGQLGALPAIATATTGVVFIPIGITYTVPGTSVTGVVTGSVPTGAISAHIRQLLTGLGGTSAVVYEVATSHVLAVSWNESVLDYSRYNISMANPIIDIKTLDTISGSFAVRTVIAALGGSSAFTAATISAGLRDTSVAGFFVSVRDVKAPNVAGLALRTLTVVPMTPAEAATTIASRVAYDIGQVGDAVAVFASTWAANGGFPADTNKLPQQLFDVMQPQMPLLAELCLADNSLSPFAFTCPTEFTYPTTTCSSCATRRSPAARTTSSRARTSRACSTRRRAARTTR